MAAKLNFYWETHVDDGRLGFADPATGEFATWGSGDRLQIEN